MEVTLEEACKLLKSGQVVALPTETVYGLAASMSHLEAIENVFKLKGRPPKNPLIVHVADACQATLLSQDVPQDFDKLARAFWPGPLTMVVPARLESVPSIVRSGLPTVALRVPGHPVTLKVVNQVGPLVMPSANLSGKPSATCLEHVAADFGDDLPVLNGGSCLKGVESTIIIYRHDRWEICRLGALSQEAFFPVLGYLPSFLTEFDQEAPLSPGQLLRHYAPKAKLTLSIPKEGSGVLIGFLGRTYPAGFRVLPLGPENDPEMVAMNLYSVLRRLDEEGILSAAVDMDFPREGLWKTIAERLSTAAHPQ